VTREDLRNWLKRKTSLKGPDIIGFGRWSFGTVVLSEQENMARAIYQQFH
jgi:hypothetical protein